MENLKATDEVVALNCEISIQILYFTRNTSM